jgi:hypothetical protein
LRSKPVLGGALVAAVAALALPAAAPAATYTDYLCLTPSGAPAPAAGFEAQASDDAEAINGCGTAGGTLRVGLKGAGPWEAGRGANLRYTAPENTTIAAFELNRASGGLTGAAAGGAGQGAFGYRIETDGAVIEACQAGQAACLADVSGAVGRAGLAAQWLQFNAGCDGAFPQQCQLPAGRQAVGVAVSSGRVTLTDDRAPTVAEVHGALVEPGDKKGVATVTFDATDQGGGLYRLLTTVDGKEVAAQSLDQGTGTCADAVPGNADLHEFTARIPCPLALASVTAAIDTRPLDDGRHEVQVVVEDAAGNRSPVFGPDGARIQVRNSDANGIGADRKARLSVWFVANRKRKLSGRAGIRYVVRGRLVDRRGRGIRGAKLDVHHVIGKQRRLLKTGLKTRKGGRLTLILPMNLFGDSKGWRRLDFSYTAFRPGKRTDRKSVRLQVLDSLGRPWKPRRAKS